MIYNNRISMSDLFANPKMSNIFPQFSDRQNINSFAETENLVLDYLKNTFNGTITGRNELLIYGKHETIIRRISAIQPIIEQLFNSMPSIVKNIRTSTKLYTSFASIGELEDTKSYGKKLTILNQVLQNINYNPDFQSPNSIPSISPTSYRVRQDAWKRRVGYKE